MRAFVGRTCYITIPPPHISEKSATYQADFGGTGSNHIINVQCSGWNASQIRAFLKKTICSFGLVSIVLAVSLSDLTYENRLKAQKILTNEYRLKSRCRRII